MTVSLNSHLYGSDTALLLDDNRDVADADLKQLVDFDDALRRRIKTVMLSRTKITDRGIKYLNALPKLASLFLSSASITDAAPLDDLPRSLEVLSLDDTEVGDRGVSKLSSLPKLRILRLKGTKATDRTVVELLKAGSLRMVCLDETETSWIARRRLETHMALNFGGHAAIADPKYYAQSLLRLLTLRARADQPQFSYGIAA